MQPDKLGSDDVYINFSILNRYTGIMTDTFLLPISIGLIIYGIYKWITKNDEFFVKKNCVHLSPTFLLGNTGKFFLKQIRPNTFFQDLYNHFPNEK